MLRWLEQLCCEDELRFGVQGDLLAAYGGPTRKLERVFTRARSDRTRGPGFKLKERTFR